LHNSLLHLLLKNGDFLNTDISQGSVATRLGCGGVIIHHLVTNFLLSLTVNKFWKSVNIWWSYGQRFGVLFFLTHGVDRYDTNRARVIFYERIVVEGRPSEILYARGTLYCLPTIVHQVPHTKVQYACSPRKSLSRKSAPVHCPNHNWTLKPSLTPTISLLTQH